MKRSDLFLMQFLGVVAVVVVVVVVVVVLLLSGQEDMIGYEPGDPLKFQVLDYDEKGWAKFPKGHHGEPWGLPKPC